MIKYGAILVLLVAALAGTMFRGCAISFDKAFIYL
jgi:hypothetical protein